MQGVPHWIQHCHPQKTDAIEAHKRRLLHHGLSILGPPWQEQQLSKHGYRSD